MLSNTADAESLRILRTLGERLHRERVRQGITASAFAERIQISRPTLRDMEGGSPGAHMGHWVRAFAVLGRGAELEALLAPAENLIEQLRAKASRRPRAPRPAGDHADFRARATAGAGRPPFMRRRPYLPPPAAEKDGVEPASDDARRTPGSVPGKRRP